jgi:hypothetical protein
LRPAGYPFVLRFSIDNGAKALQHSCVFWGDLYGTKGNNPQQPMSQLADFVRARKLFAYGEVRDYWDHPNCVGYVEEAVAAIDTN